MLAFLRPRTTFPFPPAAVAPITKGFVEHTFWRSCVLALRFGDGHSQPAIRRMFPAGNPVSFNRAFDGALPTCRTFITANIRLPPTALVVAVPVPFALPAVLQHG